MLYVIREPGFHRLACKIGFRRFRNGTRRGHFRRDTESGWYKRLVFISPFEAHSRRFREVSFKERRQCRAPGQVASSLIGLGCTNKSGYGTEAKLRTRQDDREPSVPNVV